MGNWAERLVRGELGWKTITGALLILISLIFQANGHSSQADSLLRLGEALGLVGLRDAVAKLPK